MRMTQLFSHTLREAPADSEIASHQLLLRAGFIRQLSPGIYSYLPLAHRVLNKIENVIRQEINAIGGQEVTLPFVQPAEIWQESGRWYKVSNETARFKDRNGRDMVLSGSHEEVVADLVRKEIRSYRQLPQLLYHNVTKWHDDLHPQNGIIRGREFSMNNSYSLDADWEGLDKQYHAHYQAYFKIFHRCGLTVRAVSSDGGPLEEQRGHEFIYQTPVGEDAFMFCPACNYSADLQVACFSKRVPAQEGQKPVQMVATPDCKSIESLANFLGILKSKTAKAVFMVATILENKMRSERFIFAIVRGDMEVNESKLAWAVNAIELRPATDDEIKNTGAVPGYASPVGLKNVFVVVDEIIPHVSNLVSGANKDGYHLLNVNYGRDYRADIVCDITTAGQDNPCPKCRMPLQVLKGIEVGHLSKLGTELSESLGCNYLDKSGQMKPVVMGSYGIDSSRLLACIAEAYHDAYGLIWPITVAPYDVHMVLLAGKNKAGGIDTKEIGDQLYNQFVSAGIEVLFDERDDSPGVKFNDADLIGNPLRVTVSDRALASGGVEYKRRNQPEKQVISIKEIINRILEDRKLMEAEITKNWDNL